MQQPSVEQVAGNAFIAEIVAQRDAAQQRCAQLAAEVARLKMNLAEANLELQAPAEADPAPLVAED